MSAAGGAPLNATAVPVLVVGAGIMGSGIAQVAARAGHPVWLHDATPGTAVRAKADLTQALQSLVARGKLDEATMVSMLARIAPIDDLATAASAGLVIEAIVERLDVKRDLLLALEALVSPTCILASNTSSLSVTALARGLQHPGRVVGMHFFNPVPLMKLVEVVSGLRTDAEVASRIDALARAWGKTPVHARSTPGFIVNRIARPFYAEGLALLQERALAPAELDACLRAAGFRMGPCELMDLIGHDTNFAVTQSVYEANFLDKRFQPSLVQRELVDGGLLGRKTGQGFYAHPGGPPSLPPPSGPVQTVDEVVTLHGTGPLAEALQARAQAFLRPLGRAVERAPHSDWTGVAVGEARLVLTDGRTAGACAAQWGMPEVAVFDRPHLGSAAAVWSDGSCVAFALAPQASAAWRDQAPAWLAALGLHPVSVKDTPGLVVARTIAMLVNEAADAVWQAVCTPAAADDAMKLGVNYPAGPFEWLARWSATEIASLLDRLDAHYRGERYRCSPWLRERAWMEARP